MANIQERLYIRRKHLNLTMLDIADAIGVKEATYQRYESGKIKNIPYDKIVELSNVLDCTPSYLMGWSDSPKLESNNAAPTDFRLYNIPIYNDVSAGFGATAIDSVIDYIALPFSTKNEADNTLCIRVVGNSMSPKIEDGDLIQVSRQSSVDSGDVAVVLVDNEEGFVKKVVYDEETIELKSFNPYYPPIIFNGPEVERVMVVGKVKKIIRDL